MDTITITLQLTFDDELSRSEYQEFIDKFTTLIDREAGPYGELSLDDTCVTDFEIEVDAVEY